MIETKHVFTVTDEKKIEPILDQQAVAINHMVLPEGQGLPVHRANAPVFMVVVRGEITLILDDQEAHAYRAGSIVEIPYGTRMHVTNRQAAVTELFVIKAPGPAAMP